MSALTPVAATRPGAVLADLVPASTAARARVRDVALVLGGAALTGAAAQLVVPVPGSPVPVTGQTFAALLVGAGLGAHRGLLALLVYTLAGAAGVPWLQGGTSGAGGATFGYLFGMMLAAVVVGSLARRGGDRSVLRTAGTMAAGNLAIYAIGVPYLAFATDIPLVEALAVGFVPFIVGDALKMALAMGALPTAWKLAGRR
ncbi:biotin transporter BioY [Streptomyces sulphureus]|uniref:biotin transporter BioY n=1 Tax=Streptomyces sulphureus TaxID=47758 RepID=UPI000374F92B|nr:biotin transporter BioY [Streptomyces sulphureus]